MCNLSFLLPRPDLRILIVDSDPDSMDLLTIMFEEYGIEIIAVRSAGEALEILKHVKPDLLISEICLPKEDGYSLMRQVRALDVGQQAQIPAIALTVCATQSDRAHALSVGFSKHLSKPFDIDELIDTIAFLTLTEQTRLVSA